MDTFGSSDVGKVRAVVARMLEKCTLLWREAHVQVKADGFGPLFDVQRSTNCTLTNLTLLRNLTHLTNLTYVTNLTNRTNQRKFRSQTSDSMERWNSRGGKSQGGEVKK